MSQRRSPVIDGLLSPRRRRVLRGMGAALLVAGCGERVVSGNAAFAFGGPTMGSTYTVKIAGGALSPAGQDAARRAVAKALDDVVVLMSSFRDDSDVARINRRSDGSPIPVARETLAVLALAQEVSAASHGAFDVTVAPAVDAWGFGPGHERRLVSEAESGALRERIGWAGLALDVATSSVRKATPALAVDLSGIAKGYAVERAADALAALGCTDYMVEAGGEVRTCGRNADGVPWQIAIERPDAVPQRAQRIVPLTDLAMATSGDYRNYFERDGVRYCHEMDPVTGRPVRHALASVSVVAGTCGAADAWATALMVLGPDRGLEVAMARGLAAHFIVREGGGLREFSTPALAALHPRAAG